jgi:monoamine oxidase
MRTEILIAGGGTGGVAAAMMACDLGHRVILTEETDWVGGQLTAQIVPPDEHPWIEHFGCTRGYYCRMCCKLCHKLSLKSRDIIHHKTMIKVAAVCEYKIANSNFCRTIRNEIFYQTERPID